MLVENILFLKENYPILYDEVKKVEYNIDKSNIKIEITKNGHNTLLVEKDENKFYLHSKYDPLREAEAIINKVIENETIDDNTHVIFYGLGLGYHIDIFTKRYPNITFSLYEPSIYVFHYLLDNKRLRDLSLKKMENIQCEYKPEVIDDFLNRLLNKTDKKMIIIDLPIYIKAFDNQYSYFTKRFREVIREKRQNIHTNYAHQERWVINGVMNFKEVLNTPNILMQNDGSFEGKIAILVSAGPSLDYEIENLRRVKEKGLAYIFSVGSSINTLIEYDILPDAMCSFDPSEVNQKVFQKLNTKGIIDIPLIFGSSISFEVLQQYKGPKYHMIISPDTISKYLLKPSNGEQLVILNDAPSVAVLTMVMLYNLKFSTIIFVGQNLGYSNNMRYAGGIDYGTNIIGDEKSLIQVKSVTGEDIYTDTMYNTMRKQLEMYIKTFKNIIILNTTIGGAHIEGTKFIPMETVLCDILMEKVVIGNGFDFIEWSDFYNLEYMRTKIKILNQDYVDYKVQLLELKIHTDKMSELVRNNNLKQIEIMYTKLDTLFHKIETNEFFKVFVMPMNIVVYGILCNNIKLVKYDRNEIIKAKKIIGYYESFIIQLQYADKDIEKVFAILNQNAEEILNVGLK